MTKKQIIKRAHEINNMLQRLGEKAEKLSDEIEETSDGLRTLKTALLNITFFDLEDCILNAEEED